MTETQQTKSQNTELEKCLAGDYYNCHDEVFLTMKKNARKLLSAYNALPYEQKTEKREVLQRLLGQLGSRVSIGMPFICDYGRHIEIGDHVSINMNCTFVDCNKIMIGSRVLIASNVQIYTAAHPIDPNERLTPDWSEESGEYFWRTYAQPVTIEDDCWIGGGAILLPGVTVGQGSVIGAGSVVTKDVPPYSVAVGNPCRVIRRLHG